MIPKSGNQKMGAGVLATRQNLPVVLSLESDSAYLNNPYSGTVGRHSGKVEMWEDWNINPDKYTPNGKIKKRWDPACASLSKVIRNPTTLSTHAYKKASSSGCKDRPRDSKGRFVKSDGKRSATVRGRNSSKAPKSAKGSKKSKGGRLCSVR